MTEGHGTCGIADTHSPIVPKGGEQGQDWVWFAPLGDAPFLPVPIRRFHSLRSFHPRLLKVGPPWGPEVACGSSWGNTFRGDYRVSGKLEKGGENLASRRICNPPSKNVLTYLGFADLESAAGKNAVAGLGLTAPSSSFEERRNLYISAFLGFRRHS